MRGPLILYSLLWSLILVSAGLSPAVAGGQIWLLICGVPMSLYFCFQVLKYLALRSRGVTQTTEEQALVPISLNQHVHYHYHRPEPKPEITPALAIANKPVSDLDRRAFLKLIGSAGMAVFMMQLFSGKANAAFFGSVPGPGTVGLKDSGGNLVDPAAAHPTDGYNISQVDDGVTTSYFGFVNKTGAWYIQRENATTGDYRYTKGSSSFSTNWTNRASLTYDYFDNVF